MPEDEGSPLVIAASLLLLVSIVFWIVGFLISTGNLGDYNQTSGPMAVSDACCTGLWVMGVGLISCSIGSGLLISGGVFEGVKASPVVLHQNPAIPKATSITVKPVLPKAVKIEQSTDTSTEEESIFLED
ncbi:MAG: hypothetical protein QF440_06865 [Candidatus Thalassarchaeaceae archaeon]|jgi:hypothetical protein|nr:hypothetical protein [Candidatus Thalassarchaeaceae archaeon]